MIPEQLLRHTALLRRRAARFVINEADVDDLVQDTLTAGLEHPPKRSLPLGAWLSLVMRNRARNQWRKATTRTRREALAASSVVVPSDIEIVEQLELRRVVASEVASLPEPYRSTIRSIYFDERLPRELAQAAGVSVNKVRERARRALRILRERLLDHGLVSLAE